VDHPGRSVAWGPWAIVQNDTKFAGQGSTDTGNLFEPAPDIDHTNAAVRESLIDWLTWLRVDVGYSGWRLDFVKVCCCESIPNPLLRFLHMSHLHMSHPCGSSLYETWVQALGVHGVSACRGWRRTLGHIQCQDLAFNAKGNSTLPINRACFDTVACVTPTGMHLNSPF
jgi:hypothetical protein